MIDAGSFCDRARDAGFGLYTGVPCSYLTPLIDHVIAASATDPAMRYVGASDEGCAVAIAAGAEVGGRRAVVMLQNSGLGNTVSPLTSLCAVLRLPVLLLTTLRGEPGGPPDEPQHALMGEITTRLLELMGIPWDWFPAEEDGIAPALAKALEHMERARTPYALVMRKGTVRASPSVAPAIAPPPRVPAEAPGPWAPARPARRELLEAVQLAAGPDAVVLATTGHTGRELYALGDRPNQLYLVGSMGCASSFALGLALAAPSRPVIVLDGDGAALMHLGAMATIGHERPGNLVHVLFDNEAHESTGSQPTVSATADLGAVARACRYPHVLRVSTAAELRAALTRPAGLTFVHAKVRAASIEGLPRPTMHPGDVAARLRAFLGGTRQ